MLRTPLGRFRLIGILEGISYLLLLFVGMPLKYGADLPVAVTVTGALHGVLFVLYVLALIYVKFADRWSYGLAIGAFLASLLPFGNFVLDARLRKRQSHR
ncbi:DUF3817 domain-containing protein [Paenibacillus thermoaerophilus]|uniref:DUF3817 domain-containing protein n=1 Tax=Paenibacillus thermoaerophilus TaxID=1215385 RepID=A0ABW2V3U8_9BACL|nr:DUF3817 domain-containing protein [Paenibacillus thermoaerophilus]TMV18199.1 DUF3817 domain-containing protein [Paenibacillus thermoaerophilus]